MKPEQVFKITNTVALIPWVLMMVAPRWEITERVINSNIFPLLLALVYGFYIIKTFGKTKGSFFTLSGVEKLFQNREVLLAGWVHYLVFDMFVGAWEWRDAAQQGMSHWLLVPCLFLTLMFGPVGFLIYCLLRIFVLGVGF
jgi:hypothetical protein